MNQWQMIAASIPGASHVRTQLPCQDAHHVCILAEGGAVAVVADGLGSAACAERGAQAAVVTALATVQDALTQSAPQDEAAWKTVLQEAFIRAREKLEALATAEERLLRDYATTLIVVAVTDSWIGVGQVGDGAVVALFEQETIETVGMPQRGEFANETMPLTSPDALEAVCYVCRSGRPQAVAIFTDGLQNLCLEATTYIPYQPFFAPLFAQMRTPINLLEAEQALVSFLASERLGKRSDDDKTLVLIGRMADYESHVNLQ